MNNEKITPRNVDFASWYTDVVKAAHLADYSSVKGCTVFEANGYALWERMQNVLDGMFKETGHQNVYLPVFIPENLLKKESDLINGFAPECAWITEGGSNKLEERLAFRPTSETLFSDYYAKTVKTYRDLPKLYNQWCNVVRWEKETRPFLRSREFLWQEGHTVHSTKEEAEAETNRMLDIYKTFFEEYLGIPVISGRKTEKEKFAGAEYTLTIEALMQNGISLQSGTSHYFGQKFAKAYDIKFINRNNEFEYCYQTSWGVSNRMIGALIMTHSDDRGLVLPPKIAPKQVVIIPIKNDEGLISVSEKINESLNSKGITSYVDYSDKSAGYKFAEAEVNGIPVRIEIGPRDLSNEEVTIVRRDTLDHRIVKLNDVINIVMNSLDSMQKDMYEKALNNLKDRTYDASTLDEVKEIMETKPGFVNAYWCGEEECELKMKEIKGTKSRCIIESKDYDHETCIVCGKKAKHKVVWGIQY
jgi:prolyl-tRNA synthetase